MIGCPFYLYFYFVGLAGNSLPTLLSGKALRNSELRFFSKALLLDSRRLLPGQLLALVEEASIGAVGAK